MPQPYDYSVDFSPISQGISSGVQLGLGLRQQQQREQALQQQQQMLAQQQQQDQAKAARLEEYQQAAAAGYDDPLKLQQQFPEFGAEIQTDWKNRQDFIQAGGQQAITAYYNHLKSGRIEQADDMLRQNQTLVDSLFDQGETVEGILQDSPEERLGQAEDMFTYFGGKREDLAGKAPAKMTPYQQAQLQISKDKAALDTKKAAAETEQNELKKTKLENEIKKQEQDLKQQEVVTEQNEETRKEKLDLTAQAYVIANKLAASDSLDDITGTWDVSVTPTLFPSSQQAINDALELQSILTADNLKLMSGILTDKDISFLSKISTGLNITEDGILGDQKAVRKKIKDIAGRIENRLKEKDYDFSRIGDQDFKTFSTQITGGGRGTSRGDIQRGAAAAQPPAMPSVGVVEDGHEFLGGDPKDPGNWRRL